MNIFLSLFQLIVAVCICYYEIKRASIASVFWAALIIFFSAPHFLEVLAGTSLYSEKTLINASLFSIGVQSVYFTLRFLICKLYKPDSYNPKFYTRDPYSVYAKFMFSILILSTITILAITVFIIGGVGNASWLSFYQLNSEWGLLSPIRIINFLYFPIIGVSLFFRFWNKKYFLLSLVCLLIIATLTGNRIMLLPLILVVILPIMFNRKKFNLMKWIKLLPLVFITIYLFYFYRVIRLTGSLNDFFSEFNFSDINNKIIEMVLSNDGELGLRNAFYYFLEINNQFIGLGTGATYIRLLFMFIPTSLSFGLKPTDFAITMGSAYMGNVNNTSYSMHPTFYGDLYANFGYLGICFISIWVIIFTVLDLILKRSNVFQKEIFYILVGTSYIIIARGSVYNGLFIMITGIVLFKLVSFLIGILKNTLLIRNEGKVK